jgi:hypothetical protein
VWKYLIKMLIANPEDNTYKNFIIKIIRLV